MVAMSRQSRLTITIVVVICAVTIVLIAKFLPKLFASSRWTAVAARVKGNPRAPIQITEFIDFECPACALGARYLAQLMTEHPTVIRLELKYFPLPSHRHGFVSARYAECAARQEKFWPFHDRLIERQANWSRLVDATPAFMLIAQDVGLDVDRLGACLKDASIDSFIAQNRDEGNRRGVKSTPTYYVNDKMVVGSKLLESELGSLLATIQ